MKLAFADRAYWLGDPDFAQVPRGLIDKQYAGTWRRKSICDGPSGFLHTAPLRAHPGTFSKSTPRIFPLRMPKATGRLHRHNQYRVRFESRHPGHGVVMNDEMDDFSIQPGVPNFFGLVGAEANAVEARKRPLSSMSPTIVLKDGEPLIAIGAAGGPKIISQVLLSLVNMLDLGLDPAQALARPRIHHQWFPDELMCENTLAPELQAQLERLAISYRRKMGWAFRK